MSYFSQIRRIPTVKSLLRELAEKLARFQAEQNRVDNANDIIEVLRVRYHKVKFNTAVKQAFIDSADRQFFLPFEPDGDHLRVWFRGSGWNGNFSARDYSGYDQQIYVPFISGLVEGPEGGDRLGVYLDGIRDYIDVISDDSLKMNTLTTGFTISCFIFPKDLSQHNGKNRVIASKNDDNTGLNGWVLEVIPDGSLKMSVVYNGQSATATMNSAFPTMEANDEDPNIFTDTGLNKWYLVIAVYHIGTPGYITLFVNNVKYDGSNTAVNFDYRNFLDSNFLTTGDTSQATVPIDATQNLHIGNRGGNIDSLFCGFIADFRMYFDLLFTDTQADHMWNNKLTITDIEYGSVAQVGRWFLRGTVSFTDTSFTDQSFDTPQGIHGNDNTVYRAIVLRYVISPVTPPSPAQVGNSLVLLYSVINNTPNPPPPPNTGGNDKLGVLMIYPTKSGGDEWFMNWSNLDKDSRFDTQTSASDVTKNGDNASWKTVDPKVRMDIFTFGNHFTDSDRGNHETYDYSKLKEKGYWYQPDDWLNVECTAYIKMNDSDTFWGFVTRSVQHQPDQHAGCGGSSYHGNINLDGTIEYKKEQWHVDYVQGGKYHKDIGLGSVKGKWVGLKSIVYNKEINGKMCVIEEIWIDRNNNNNWSKEMTVVDSGGIGSTMDHCGNVPKDQIITWGSPSIIMKSNIHGGGSIDFKKCSIREISPP